MSATQGTQGAEKRPPVPTPPPEQRFSCLPGLLLAYFILAVIAVGCVSQQVPR
ncbi:hypothetical protein [Wenjunlia tyrosinilytica]|uniref:hypothetical protein n=1 Tax=Wenjunlia tyrosinilytica TaxID=1544741 RepID=UPI00166A97B1|nr:hypothetical protein [Wenjunlia tyrosinilytica]